MRTEREIMRWWEVESASVSLYEKIKKYNVGLIIGISRGGLAPAVMMAHRLGIRNVISWDIGEDSKDFKKFLKSEIEMVVSFGKQVLIVDDIFDSGGTFNRIIRRLRTRLPLRYISGDETKIIVSALYRREKSKLSIPEFMNAVKMVYGERVRHSRWLVFPWDRSW